MTTDAAGRPFFVDAELCANPWSRARGLMFSGKRTVVLDFGCEQPFALHTLFVFFPIHVYVLNERRAVRSAHKLLPFIPLPYRAYGRYALESPEPLPLESGDLVNWPGAPPSLVI